MSSNASILALSCCIVMAASVPVDDQWEESTVNVPEHVPLPAIADPTALMAQDEMVAATDAERWTALHNKYRCMHGVPNVQWSAAMAASAQEWANQGQFKHSNCYQLAPPAGPAGENLAMGHGSLEAATTAWYNEISNCGPFPGCSTSSTGVTGHFTPIVWKGVKEIGCGINQAKKMYVCRYKGDDSLNCNTPNMGGCYTSNVLAATKSGTACNAPSTPPPTPPPSSPSGGGCSYTDGWNGCTGWKVHCGKGYNMRGSGQKLDDFCGKTCKC